MTDTYYLGLKSEFDVCVALTTRLHQLSEYLPGSDGLVRK